MSVDVSNFKPSKNFELKCLKDLEKIRDKILSIFKKYSNSAFNIPDLLKQITNTKDFQEFTDTLAKRFFARCVDKNNDTFRKSFFGRAYKIFKNLTGDEDLITFIRNQVNEKANLFRTIPIELANSLIPHVNKWALEGKTSKGIFDDLKSKLPDLLDFQIRRIARTEISKTLTNITEFKCGQGEVNIYQWKASGGERGDGRTRYSHRKMANVLIMWGDPPAPEDLFPVYGKNGKRYKNTLGHYHAGCCPNCRCVAMPVVSISDIEFPAHIYMNGAIRKINKQDLIKLLKIDNDLKQATTEAKTEEQNKNAKNIIENLNQEPINKTIEIKTENKPIKIFKNIKEEAINYLFNNFNIPKENIYLDDFNDTIIETLKEVFINLKNIQQEIQDYIKKKIEFTTINHIGSENEFYNIITSKENLEKAENYIKNEIKKMNPNIDESDLNLITQKQLKKYIKDLEKYKNNKRTRAIAINPIDNPTIDEKYMGIYIYSNILSKYNPDADDNQWKPPNTNNLKGTINHEIGHTLDFLFDLSSNKKIQKLYKEDLKRWGYIKKKWFIEWKGEQQYLTDFKTAVKEAQKEYEKDMGKSTMQKFGYDFDIVSRYSFENKNKNSKENDKYYEFIAEVISEIFTVGAENARPFTQKVWKEIKEAIKNSNKIS